MVLHAEGISRTGLHLVFDLNTGNRRREVNELGRGSVRKFSSSGFYLPGEIGNQDHQLVVNMGKVRGKGK